MKPALIAVWVALFSGVLLAETGPSGQIIIKIIPGQAAPVRTDAPEGINVIGAVKQPGFVKAAAPISVHDVLAAVGGISRLSDRSMVSIVDYASGDTYQIQFPQNLSPADKNAVLSRTFLKPGDILLVPERYD